jgi:carbon starvation protein
MFLLVSWTGLVLVIAEFNRQIAGTFIADPATATSSLLFIAEAILFGLCVYKWRISVVLASLIFVPLMFVFVWIGNVIPFDLVKLLGITPDLARIVWILFLLLYCFIASTCPVQFLLQPRDYLNAYLLYVMMALGILGVLVAHPVLNIDAFAGFSAVGKSGASDMLFPFLFVTVACGACSGFHALVASGTSSKQISNERSIRPVGYGGMLLEGVLAMIALIGVAGTYACQKDYVSAIQTMEPVQMFASTIAGFCVKIGIPQRIAESFMLLAVAAFLMTTVDSSTRLARFTWQELMPNKKGIACNMYVATFIVCAIVAGFLLGSPAAAKQLWTLFASTNQMLASLALLTATLWFYRNGKPCWMTAIPMVLMFGVSAWALASILVSAASSGQWIRLVASSFLLMLAVSLVVVAVSKARSSNEVSL